MEFIYPFFISFLMVFVSELGDKTQLLVLSFSGKDKTFKILLDQGVPNLVDQNGQLPIHYSAVLNRPKYTLDLLQSNNELYIKDQFGNTPRDYIFRKADPH